MGAIRAVRGMRGVAQNRRPLSMSESDPTVGISLGIMQLGTIELRSRHHGLMLTILYAGRASESAMLRMCEADGASLCRGLSRRDERGCLAVNITRESGGERVQQMCEGGTHRGPSIEKMSSQVECILRSGSDGPQVSTERRPWSLSRTPRVAADGGADAAPRPEKVVPPATNAERTLGLSVLLFLPTDAEQHLASLRPCTL